MRDASTKTKEPATWAIKATITIQYDDDAVSGRREILKAGLALATLPILAATSAGAKPQKLKPERMQS